MATTLDIITITRQDREGLLATVRSTARLRGLPGVRQIVVDGSEDDQPKINQARLAAEPSLVYQTRPAQGIADAFNAGVAAATADWLWFLNGRDEVHPELDVGFLLRILETTKADAVICEIEFLQSRARSPHPPLWKQWPPLYWLPHPATFLRRSLFERLGGVDGAYRIGMDGELWLRFFSTDAVVDTLAIPTTLYDVTGLSSRTPVGDTVREVDRMVVRHFRSLFKIWLRQGFYLFRAVRGRIVSTLLRK